jgi:hypothetical protein
MKRRLIGPMLYLSLLAAVLSACGNQAVVTEVPEATTTVPPAATESVIEPTSAPEAEPSMAGEATAQDYAGLVSALEAAGATVEAAGEVQQPFFGPPGQVIKVNGADVQVFEYPEAEVVAHDADQVANDGSSIGTQVMMWMATPHFYKSGKLIVLYVGDDGTVISLLIRALGPQFAGR